MKSNRALFISIYIVYNISGLVSLSNLHEFAIAAIWIRSCGVLGFA